MNETELTGKQAKWGITALVLLYLLSVLVNLGAMELEGEEPRRAVVSLEMMQNGNYLNPTLFGWPYYNKPPVFNWILIGFMKLFQSSSEAVLRLPSLAFYALWAWVHYCLCSRYFSKRLSLLAAFFLLTSGDIYFYGLGNGAEIDVFYSFVVYLQAVAIFYCYEQKKWLRLFLFSYLACAIGFLTKGFPSLLFQLLTLAALCWYAKSIRFLFTRQHAAGIALFAGIVGLYFLRYGFEGNVKHLLVNFLNESLVKSAIGERSNKVVEKAVAYPFLLIKLVAPWTLLLLLLGAKNIRRQLWQNPVVRFSGLFIIANLWIYWLTGQPKARYVYMFAPFATLVFIQLLQSATQQQMEKLNRVLLWMGSIFLLAALGLLVSPFFIDLNKGWSIVSGIFIGVFALLYLKTKPYLRIWAFVLGVVLVRLVYAVVFIPFQDKGTAYYEAPVQAAAKAFGNGPLQYWAPPQPFVVKIDTRLFAWQADTLLAPPHIHPQIPYYYYRHTGKLMRYDTLLKPGGNYVSFARDIQGRRVDTAGFFSDKRQTEQIILYRIVE